MDENFKMSDLETGVVDKADSHQVGRVLPLEEVEHFVLQVSVGLWVDVEGSPGARGEPTEGVLRVGGGALHLEHAQVWYNVCWSSRKGECVYSKKVP